MSLVLVTSSEWYSRPLLLFIHLHWLISVPVLALQASLAVLPWDTAVLQCLTTAMGGVAWVSVVTSYSNYLNSCDPIVVFDIHIC